MLARCQTVQSGAAVGRLYGEGLAILFPTGMGGNTVAIVPGSYALIGAAAFSGAATHAVSMAIFVFELTGQLAHILPCLVLIFDSLGSVHILRDFYRIYFQRCIFYSLDGSSDCQCNHATISTVYL